MNQRFMAMAFQEVASDTSSMWIILAVVLVILVFIVVIVGVGLTIFFIARKRSKAQKAAAAAAMSTGTVPPAIESTPLPEAEQISPPVEASPMEAYAPASVPPLASELEEEAAEPDFDPTRTVAINREPTISINYGSIKFVSGVLAGQEFSIKPEGNFIGRDSNVSEIVVGDPRISKRHLWIGVRDGKVTIADQDSRNGTFVNDPRSERITEVALNPGDTVILGESDVARFEYQG